MAMLLERENDAAHDNPVDLPLQIFDSFIQSHFGCQAADAAWQPVHQLTDLGSNGAQAMPRLSPTG